MCTLKCEFCNNVFEYKLNNFFCTQCKKLNKLLPYINYFNYLNIKENFPIDYSQLEENYIKLFALFHPDNFVLSSSLEQLNAINHSAFLNEAYLTLKNISKLILYLYNLNTQEELNLDIEFTPELALYFFELNEELGSLNTVEEKQNFKNKIQKLYNETLNEITQVLKKHEYKKIKEGLFSKLKYIENLRNRLK